MTFELKQYLTQKQELINHHLIRILQTHNPQRELVMAMEHSLMAGGKRLRPILCMAAAQACAKDDMPALPVSCAIEMIHTYSLIHDDLPAMDDDDLRRGVPTCHKKFCEATAILAGDALLTHAFYVLAQPEIYFDIYPGIKARLQLVGKVATSAGISGMVEGQMLDMQADQGESNHDLKHLKRIHELKTGKMICVSVQAGAISIGADQPTIKKLVTYADKIGLAFQVVDDILNIEGNPDIMGKAAGSDALNNKMTFPAIIGLDASKKYAKELIDNALEALSGFQKKAVAPLQAIAHYIINRDH
ncbi:MAG: polyprenyl synthetase family protein [Desulfobacula sp.]|nr:polyprenyl synthetase family protein [Desulfobacula sp.]